MVAASRIATFYRPMFAAGRMAAQHDHARYERQRRPYLKSNGTTVNHFYEKLLLLRERMNTASGRSIAEKRRRFMEEYLGRFHREWEGGE
jgi:HD superfamily phosphodiesterase